MPVELNHTIVWSGEPEKSAAFLAEILGLPAPRRFMHFHVVDLTNGVSLDFMQHDGVIVVQHYAFLVSDAEFDQIFERVQGRQLKYWADPARTMPSQLNHYFGGRGFYFEDPDSHLLEIITRPYALE